MSRRRVGWLRIRLMLLAVGVVVGLTGLWGILGGASLPAAHAQAAPTCFTAALAGASEVPPNASTASGAGSVLLSSGQTTITVNLSWVGLAAPATAGHIHGPAPAGVNAAVLFPFAGIAAATAGTYNQSFAITPVQVAQLQAGLFYFNIHNAVFPGGEIRGQILPTACSAPPAQVPEGDTLVLVGTGLAGLAGYAGLRWRARRAQRAQPT